MSHLWRIGMKVRAVTKDGASHVGRIFTIDQEDGIIALTNVNSIIPSQTGSPLHTESQYFMLQQLEIVEITEYSEDLDGSEIVQTEESTNGDDDLRKSFADMLENSRKSGENFNDLYTVCPCCLKNKLKSEMTHMPTQISKKIKICNFCHSKKFNRFGNIRIILNDLKKRIQETRKPLKVTYAFDTITTGEKGGGFGVAVAVSHLYSINSVLLLLHFPLKNAMRFKRFKKVINFIQKELSNLSMSAVAMAMDGQKFFWHLLRLKKYKNVLVLGDLIHNIHLTVTHLLQADFVKFCRMDFVEKDNFLDINIEIDKNVKYKFPKKKSSDLFDANVAPDCSGSDFLIIQLTEAEIVKYYADIMSITGASGFYAVEKLKIFFQKERIHNLVDSRDIQDSEKQHMKNALFVLRKLFYFAISPEYFNENHEKILEEAEILLKFFSLGNEQIISEVFSKSPRRILEFSKEFPGFYIPSLTSIALENVINSYNNIRDPAHFLKQFTDIRYIRNFSTIKYLDQEFKYQSEGNPVIIAETLTDDSA